MEDWSEATATTIFRHHSATAIISSISLQENNLQLVASLLAVGLSSAITNNASFAPRPAPRRILLKIVDGIFPSFPSSPKHIDPEKDDIVKKIKALHGNSPSGPPIHVGGLIGGQGEAGAKRQQRQDAICRSATASAIVLHLSPSLRSSLQHPLLSLDSPLSESLAYE